MFNRWMTKRDNKRGHLIHLHTSLKSRKMVSPIRRGMLVSPMFFFCSFVWGVPSNSRIFHSYRDVISCKAANFKRCWALTTVEQLVFKSVPQCQPGHPLIIIWSSSRTRDTHTFWRAFGSGAVTTFSGHLGLPRLGFEHPTCRMRGERSDGLRPRRG